MNNVNIVNSLKLMGMGMTSIFVVIVVIYLVVNLMLRLTKEKR